MTSIAKLGVPGKLINEYKNHFILLSYSLFIIKYWKLENVSHVQNEWTCEFSSQPPTRLTISRIRDKFEKDGTVRDVMEYTGRPSTTTSPDSVSVVIEKFTNSPTKSIWQCSRETGVSKIKWSSNFEAG